MFFINLLSWPIVIMFCKSLNIEHATFSTKDEDLFTRVKSVFDIAFVAAAEGREN